MLRASENSMLAHRIGSVVVRSLLMVAVVMGPVGVVIYFVAPSSVQVWAMLATGAGLGVVALSYGLLSFTWGMLGNRRREQLQEASIRATTWGALTLAFGVGICVICVAGSLPLTGGRGPANDDWPRLMIVFSLVGGALAHLALLDDGEKKAGSKGLDAGLARARLTWLSSLNLEDIGQLSQGTLRCRSCGASWAMYAAGSFSPLRPHWWVCLTGCNVPQSR